MQRSSARARKYNNNWTYCTTHTKCVVILCVKIKNIKNVNNDDSSKNNCSEKENNINKRKLMMRISMIVEIMTKIKVSKLASIRNIIILE